MPAFVPPSLKIARHKSVFDANGSIAQAKDMPSEIVSGFLYLGSAKSAANVAEMQRLGICRYLCCAEEVPNPNHISPESIESGEVHILRIPMKDGVKTNLQENFAAAFRFLRDAKRAQEPVLVFCREGKSRSASITIAYLMRYAAMRYEEAIAVVRSRRAVVDPNVGFCTQLSEFSAAMEAERQAVEPTEPGRPSSFATSAARPPCERARSVKILEVDSHSDGGRSFHSQPNSNCHTPNRRGESEADLQLVVSPKVLLANRLTTTAKSATRGSIQGSASAYDLRETLLRQLDNAPLNETSNALAASTFGLSLRSPSVNEGESEVELASPSVLLSRSQSIGAHSHDNSRDAEEAFLEDTDDELVEPLLDENEMTSMLLSTPGSPTQQRLPGFPRPPSGSNSDVPTAV